MSKQIMKKQEELCFSSETDDPVEYKSEISTNVKYLLEIARDNVLKAFKQGERNCESHLSTFLDSQQIVLVEEIVTIFLKEKGYTVRTLIDTKYVDPYCKEKCLSTIKLELSW